MVRINAGDSSISAAVVSKRASPFKSAGGFGERDGERAFVGGCDDGVDELLFGAEAGANHRAAVAGAAPDLRSGRGLVAAFRDQFGGGVDEACGGFLAAFLLGATGGRHGSIVPTNLAYLTATTKFVWSR